MIVSENRRPLFRITLGTAKKPQMRRDIERFGRIQTLV